MQNVKIWVCLCIKPLTLCELKCCILWYLQEYTVFVSILGREFDFHFFGGSDFFSGSEKNLSIDLVKHKTLCVLLLPVLFVADLLDMASVAGVVGVAGWV